MRISDWSSDVCSSDLVWTGQEPTWDSPINRGSHCVKGASVRELVHSDRRLKYPLKLVDGQWQRVSWDEAIGGNGDKLMETREKSGPETVYWWGWAKFSNEGTYLFRKPDRKSGGEGKRW